MTIPHRRPVAAPTHEHQPQPPPEHAEDGRILATPYARSLARSTGVDLGEITGTTAIHGADLPAAGTLPTSVADTQPTPDAAPPPAKRTAGTARSDASSHPELPVRIAGTVSIAKTAEADATAVAAAVLAGMFAAETGDSPIEAALLTRHGRSAPPSPTLIAGFAHGDREAIDSALRATAQPNTDSTAVAEVHCADDELNIEELDPQPRAEALLTCGIGNVTVRPHVKYVDYSPTLATTETVRISLSSTRLSTAALADVFSAIGNEIERWKP